MFQYVDLWSSTFTWGGQGQPVAGDLVVIQPGQFVLFDTQTPVLKMVLVQGKIFKHNLSIAGADSESSRKRRGGWRCCGLSKTLNTCSHTCLIRDYWHLLVQNLIIPIACDMKYSRVIIL